ncbi:MAG: dihydroorotate dehydrogenase electron transfer subunit [Bacillota bacterium]
MMGSPKGGPGIFAARVARNIPEGTARRLVLTTDQRLDPEPGQFLQIEVPGGGESAYLRRPLSISDWDEHRRLVELMILPVGYGTEILAGLRPGTIIDCLGPLGRGFPLEDLGERPILIAGGIGSAPLIYLARKLVEMGRPPRVFIGASEADRLAGEKALAALSSEIVVATEDGSRGESGMITWVLERRRPDLREATALAACGPRGMLAAVKALGAKMGIPTYGSLEERMACGVGACLGCAVPLANPEAGKQYVRVCADGPVFPLEEVVLS